MIARFFLFEVRYWLRQPMVYIFLLVFGFFGWGFVASENFSLGGVGNTNKNAPFIIYLLYSVMSFLGILLVTAFVNGTAIRDFTSNTAQIIFSTPVSRLGYLMGKFLGSTLIATLPLIGVSLGALIGSQWSGVDPLRIGPERFAVHAQAFCVIGLPNVLFTAAIIFAVAVNVRTTLASFMSAIVLFVGYIISGVLTQDMENETLASMLDPFGGEALELVTKYWTVEDKNTLLLPVSGVLLWNRLLWTGVAIAVFAFGYFRFSFTEKAQAGKSPTPAPEEKLVFGTITLPSVRLDFSRMAGWRQFMHLFWSDLRGILKSTPFILIMSVGLVMLFVNLAFVTTNYGNTDYPVTYNVVDQMRGALFIFLIIIVTFYSGQLVWKERDPKMDGIVNALPTATRTGLLSKFLALIGVLLVIHLFAVLSGMVTQLLNGYTRLQPMVYLTYFVIPGVLQFVFFAALGFLVHVLVNNKYLGFFAFIVVVVLNIFIWSVVDVSSNLVQLNGTSGLQYSDMNGFGPFLKGWFWFRSYWLLFAGILLFVGYLFLVRGNDLTFALRSRLAKQRLGRSRRLGFALMAAWVVMVGFGYYNTKVLNEYTGSEEQEERQVRYEKTYKRLEGRPQPHYTDLEFVIDLDPGRRALSYSVDVVLKNKHSVAIDTLLLDVPHDMNVELEVANAMLALEDEDLDLRFYELSPPLAPGAELRMKVRGTYRAKGFENTVSLTQIVQNGSFFNNMNLIPGIGYNAGVEITDRADRRKHGLPPNDRMPKLTADPAERMQNYLLANSDWVNVRTTIGTAPDQIAIAPGSLKKEWSENGKRWFRYEVDHPSLNFYSFMSARYEVAREKWNDVDLEVYYQKEHGVNVPRMLNSMRKSLSYYSEHFGPYRHKQARIIEFPRYSSFAQAFPGTMPYSESIGFIIDLTADDDIDMVFYVVAHEMGHQWWAHQVMGAEMQGGTLLSESMAQYSALMVMEKEYGRQKMRKFLKFEQDRYQNARGSEDIGETPIMQVENQGYIHYNKGSVVLYCLREYLGEDTINSAFRALVDSFGYAEPPWPTALDMYRELDRVTPDSLTYLLEDNLKYITFYNNKLVEAGATMNADSTWTVNVKLTAEKVHADSLGGEVKVPMNDWLDIAIERKPVFGRKADKSKNDIPLVQQRVRLKTGENALTFSVDEKPQAVVIDPDHLFFDRVASDNRMKVEVE